MTMMNKESFAAMLATVKLGEAVVAYQGDEYRLREMTEEQGAAYELALQDKKGNFDLSKARRLMLAYMLVDDAGNRLVEDESQLKALPRSLAGLLYERCIELNRYSDNDVKDLVKNSEEAAG